jgi:hypothetical protein
MKKFWWFLLLLLLKVSPLWNQKIPNSETPTINVTANQVVNGWAKYNNECLGCVSFFYQVRRTAGIHIDGYYYYYVYFHSNSYYSNAIKSSTYLSGVKFYLNQKFVFQKDYILIKPGEPQYVAWLRSKASHSYVNFTWQNLNIY